MHRIDTKTAQSDKFGAGKNGYTNGDKTVGRLATQLDADVFDAFQEEICGVIEGAGIALNKADRSQLLKAVKSLFLNKSQNLGDLNNIAKALENLGLNMVGNWAAVQADGGKHSSGNHRYYMDWGTDGKLHITVDATDVGELFTTQNPPTSVQVGAYPVSGGAVTGEVWSKVVNNFRLIEGDRGVFWRFDGVALYLMFTNDDDPHGGYNALRPLMADFATGKLSTGHDFTSGGTLYGGGGSCWMATDGNIYGSIWGGYLSQWLSSQINTAVNNINQWANNSFITGHRQASAQWSGRIGSGLQIPAGCVVIGAKNNGSSDVAHMGLLYAAEQICINGNWMTIGLV